MHDQMTLEFYEQTFAQNRAGNNPGQVVPASQALADQPQQSPQPGPGPSPQQSSPQSTSVEEGPDSSSREGNRKVGNAMLIQLLSQDDPEEDIAPAPGETLTSQPVSGATGDTIMQGTLSQICY